MAVLIAVLACLLVTGLAFEVFWLASRLARLTNRVEAARAGLDAQLVRRAAAVQALVDSDPVAFAADSERLRALCRAALDSDGPGREAAENDLGRALIRLPPGGDPDRRADLADAAERVVLARRFYNDVVRDTLALGGRRLPRLLRLGRGPTPGFFEIADTVLPAPEGATSAAGDGRGQAESPRHPH